MSELPSVHTAVPFLRSSEEQAAKIRWQLENVYNDLKLVQDLLRVCSGASKDDVETRDHVLRRCGSDRLFSVQRTLTKIIERFGGTTELSKQQPGGNQ
jgi:hypothetical protein